LDSLNSADIASVEVFKLASGAVAPDAVGVIWIQLRAPGEAASPATRAMVASRAQASAPAAARTDTLSGSALRQIVVTGARTGEQPSARARRALITTEASGSTPLYIIDGVAAAKDAVERLQPTDIESVEVVKGTAAERIYGTRGTNGVIVITTKAGKRTGAP
jgi:TonB-dependent SusC/RagA subfamily outer membrane receptor